MITKKCVIKSCRCHYANSGYMYMHIGNSILPRTSIVLFMVRMAELELL